MEGGGEEAKAAWCWWVGFGCGCGCVLFGGCVVFGVVVFWLGVLWFVCVWGVVWLFVWLCLVLCSWFGCVSVAGRLCWILCGVVVRVGLCLCSCGTPGLKCFLSTVST